MKSARLVLLSLIAFAFLAALAPVQAQEKGLPNLTGTWQMDQAKSDDIAAIMRKNMGGGRDHGDVPGSNPGRREGMGGGRGRNGMNPSNKRPSQGFDEDRAEEAKKRAEQIKQEYNRLEIFQDGAELNFTNGLDISQLLRTDGNPTTVWTPRGEATATAAWEGPTLVVSISGAQEKAPRIRRFHISEDGQTLTVTEERPLPGGEGKALIRLVYNRQS